MRSRISPRPASPRRQVADEILERCHVVTEAGTFYGAAGEGRLRVCFGAEPYERIDAGARPHGALFRGRPMSKAAANLDRWIRSAFVAMNTELEELYFAQTDRANVDGIGDDIKQRLAEEGRALIRPLAAEGNTNEGFENAFNVLGNLGLFMAALRRHELTNPARETPSPFAEASALGLHIGASLGVTPRFATAHLATHNKAIDGVQKSFTSLTDEFVFIDYNTMGILSYKRAVRRADAHSAARHLQSFDADAVQQRARCVEGCGRRPTRSCSIRSTRIASSTACGPTTSHIASDVRNIAAPMPAISPASTRSICLLGLCRANDPSYSQLLIDKMLFMIPEDQANLRQCLLYAPFLDQFLDAAKTSSKTDWFRDNCRAYLEVCEAHGFAAIQHHNQLFESFIVKMSEELDSRHHAQLTASGPPLDVLARSLERLRDLRAAAKRDDFETAHDGLALLKKAVG